MYMYIYIYIHIHIHIHIHTHIHINQKRGQPEVSKGPPRSGSKVNSPPRSGLVHIICLRVDPLNWHQVTTC